VDAFFEHVAAPQETWLRQVQSGVKPIGKYSATVATDREGCFRNAGFESVNYHHFQAPVPIVSPHIAGVATKKQIRASARQGYNGLSLSRN